LTESWNEKEGGIHSADKIRGLRKRNKFRVPRHHAKQQLGAPLHGLRRQDAAFLLVPLAPDALELALSIALPTDKGKAVKDPGTPRGARL